MKASQWGCSRGVSLSSELCLAENEDDLQDEITILVVIFLLPEPDDSSDDVADKSSEDKDSDEIIIVFCAIWTRSSSLVVSIKTSSSSPIVSLWLNVFPNIPKPHLSF